MLPTYYAENSELKKKYKLTVHLDIRCIFFVSFLENSVFQETLEVYYSMWKIPHCILNFGP